MRETKSISASSPNIETEVESLLRHLPVAAIIADSTNGIIREVNRVAESTFGLSREEFCGLTPMDISPEYQDEGRKSSTMIKQKLKNISAKGSETFFWHHKHKSGRTLPCIVHTSKIPSLENDLFLGLATEITEEHQLLQSLAEYKRIVDRVSDKIAIVDTNFVYQFVNPAFCKMFDKTAQDIVGKKVPDIIGQQSFDEIAKEKYEQCFEGEPVRFQTLYSIPTLGDRLLDIQYFPHRYPNQFNHSVVSCIRDITNTERLQKSLDNSETKFKAFMDNLPANVYIKDENDFHIYFNSKTAELMGCNVNDLVGKTTYDFFPKKIAEKLVSLDKVVLADGASRLSEEWNFGGSKGNRCLRDIKFPINLPSGEKLLGGIAIDITDIKQNEIRLEKALTEVGRLKELLESENALLKEELQLISPAVDIVGESKSLKNCLLEAEQVAREQTTVLILGETGTGKELLAQAIHDMSPRKNRTMVKVNCAALPANLIESELFGREKGAYTGAMTKQEGRFKQADRSTIFLDEIGDLPLELQSKLLRVLQEGSFEMLGSTQPIEVDVRIIAATNRDLRQLVKEGLFRKDLYYRINVFPITSPSLADRREDIPILAYTFVESFNQSMGKAVTKIKEADLNMLKNANWPGNVRELRNVIERSMILSSGSDLQIKSSNRTIDFEDTPSGVGETLADVERSHIQTILESTGWRVSGNSGAAIILGLKPTTLEARMKKLGIRRPA